MNYLQIKKIELQKQKKEYKNGDYITNEEADNEIDQWLKEE